MTISKEWLTELMAKSTADGKVAIQFVYDKHVQRAKGQSGISKAWLLDCIRAESIPERRLAYQQVYDKLIEKGVSTDGKSKEFDHNKIYENILLFYINQGKTPTEAHVIAQRIVEEQKERQKIV